MFWLVLAHSRAHVELLPAKQFENDVFAAVFLFTVTFIETILQSGKEDEPYTDLT